MLGIKIGEVVILIECVTKTFTLDLSIGAYESKTVVLLR